MNFYFDTNNNNFYCVSNRNGSTILKEISAAYPSLKVVADDEIFEILKQDFSRPIYIPFRDPVVRFRSGLSVNFFNRTGTVLDQADEKELESYAQSIKYLRSALHYTGTYYSSYPNEFYHLFDSHIDHWLWVAMIIGVYNYNVKLLPMYDLSKHLMTAFPKASSLIKSRSRTDSFDKSKVVYEKIWGYYKSVMIDDVELKDYQPQAYLKKPEISYTFDNWMRFESELFTNYKNFHASLNLRNLFVRLSKKAFEDPFYLTDSLSPKMHTICGRLLPILHKIHEPILDYGNLQDLFRAYDQSSKNVRYKKYEFAERAKFTKKDIL